MELKQNVRHALTHIWHNLFEVRREGTVAAAMRLRALCYMFLVIATLSQWRGANSQTSATDDDLLCLQGFQSGVQDPKNYLSASWSGTGFPCNKTNVVGVTCSSGRVVELSLEHAGLGGFIHPNLSLCGNLNILILASNQLTGTIPAQLGLLPNLVTLKLDSNILSGSIPSELYNCSYLNVVDLHNNRLTGAIPPELGSLTRLKTFDVSNNDLSGQIPVGLSNTSTGAPRFNDSSFLGNDGLYGYPLPPAKEHSLSVLAIVGIGLASGLLSLCLSFTAVCIWLRVTEQRLAAEEGKISQLVPEY